MRSKSVTILFTLVLVAFTQNASCTRLLPILHRNSTTNGILPGKRPATDQKIVGGTVSDISHFPYQLSLRIDNRHFCGASIISTNYAITAAHCVDKKSDWPKIAVVAGTQFRTNGGVTYSLEQVMVHPNYDSKNVNNDIAILKIRGVFQMNERIEDIELPRRGSTTSAGTTAVVSGWGKIRSNGLLLPLRLQSASVAVYDFEQCKENYRRLNMTITDKMLCAGGNGRQDSCQGDSGGPLAADGWLIGVVSWGAGCARKGLPGVYTNVANTDIRNWISNNTGGL